MVWLGLSLNNLRLPASRQSAAQCLAWASTGSIARYKPLTAPALVPTIMSGTMPARSSCRTTPTSSGPRLPPPDKTNARMQ